MAMLQLCDRAHDRWDHGLVFDCSSSGSRSGQSRRQARRPVRQVSSAGRGPLEIDFERVLPPWWSPPLIWDSVFTLTYRRAAEFLNSKVAENFPAQKFLPMQKNIVRGDIGYGRM